MLPRDAAGMSASLIKLARCSKKASPDEAPPGAATTHFDSDIARLVARR
jgi:hypothetical protein